MVTDELVGRAILGADVENLGGLTRTEDTAPNGDNESRINKDAGSAHQKPP